MTVLHVLLDPSGAYQCLENSLVCSHLESLVTRIRVSLERNDRTVRAGEDRWLAFQGGRDTDMRRVSLGRFGQAELIVRETARNLIMNAALPFTARVVS